MWIGGEGRPMGGEGMAVEEGLAVTPGSLIGCLAFLVMGRLGLFADVVSGIEGEEARSNLAL